MPQDIIEDESQVMADLAPAHEYKLTYGGQAVWLDFNPSWNPQVNRLKKLFAEIIDELDQSRAANTGGEAVRLLSIAITEAQTAQMWAVKAVTWK